MSPVKTIRLQKATGRFHLLRCTGTLLLGARTTLNFILYCTAVKVTPDQPGLTPQALNNLKSICYKPWSRLEGARKHGAIRLPQSQLWSCQTVRDSRRKCFRNNALCQALTRRLGLLGHSRRIEPEQKGKNLPQPDYGIPSQKGRNEPLRELSGLTSCFSLDLAHFRP